jgi:hypothetical protein
MDSKESPRAASPSLDYRSLMGLPAQSLMSWLVGIALCALAFVTYETPVQRAGQLDEWLGPSRHAQAAIHVHRAFHGDRAYPVAAGGAPIFDGSFAVDLAAQTGRIFWTLAVPADSPVLFWTCGYARPTVPPVAAQDRQTDVPPELLPPICRNLP